MKTISSYNGWEQINKNGFGNPRNRYAWSMDIFRPPNTATPRLYVGTTNDFDALPRPEIWSFPLSDKDEEEWNLEFTGNQRGFRKMKVFNENLYIGTMKDPPFHRLLLYFFKDWGCHLYRYNGEDWINVIDSGFGSKCHSVRSMSVFNNQLYVGTSNLIKGGQVWRTKEGVSVPDSQNDWEQCNIDGFGTGVQNTGIFSLKVFNNCLWAGTANGVNGCELWKYDGMEWEQVIGYGFVSRFNIAAMNIEIFKSKLYVGTYNPLSGCQIWRYPADNSFGWENVMVGGFYNLSNAYIWSLKSYVDKGIDYLYAGTFIGLELKKGAELWRSTTGEANSWEQVIRNGFNDPCNYGIRNLITYRKYLFAGTARPPKIITFSKKLENLQKSSDKECRPGCEVWRYPGGG